MANYSCLFQPGQGTGNSLDFPELSLKGIPKPYIPRKKDPKHFAEAYFAVGTLLGENGMMELPHYLLLL